MVYHETLGLDAYNLTTNIYELTATTLGISKTTAIIILTIIAIWSLIWKGFALWKSARKNHLIWFIVLLIISTVGILEILYIFVFSELGKKRNKLNK